MRILLLAQWYPPIIGGEELHVRNLAVDLVRRGHDVTVGTLAQAALPMTEETDGVKVVRLRSSVQRLPGLFADSRRQSAAPLPDPELMTGLGRLLRRTRAQVVHAHNWIVHSALPVSKVADIPLVLSLHDFSLVCATKVLLRRGVNCSGPGLRKCLSCAADHYGPAKGEVTTIGNWAGAALERRWVSRFIAVSAAVARENRLTGLPYRVIPNFVPDAPPPAEAGTDPFVNQLPKQPFLLFVGALGRLKGLAVLLEAYRLLVDPPPLVLIGYRMRETQGMLADLPPNVMALGEWPHEAVQRAWKAALLAIVPSICREACPTVVIEAMQAGTPVVASRTGGIPDLVVDGETGVLVRHSDAQVLADAISSLLVDPARASRMGAAGARRSLQFTASAVVPRIEEAYREVLETGILRSAPS